MDPATILGDGGWASLVADAFAWLGHHLQDSACLRWLRMCPYVANVIVHIGFSQRKPVLWEDMLACVVEEEWREISERMCLDKAA